MDTARAREILGPEWEYKTDAEVEQTINRLRVIAKVAVEELRRGLLRPSKLIIGITGRHAEIKPSTMVPEQVYLKERTHHESGHISAN